MDRTAAADGVERSVASTSGSSLPTVSASLPASMRRATWEVGQFQLKEQLHKGSVSRVNVAIDRQSGTPVALKMYLKSKMGVLSRHQVEREIHIHLQLEHENIIKCYAAFEDDKGVYLVQELARGGDLFKCVKRRASEAAEEEQADEGHVVVELMVPFISALRYLHGKGILHRDIKPENILLTSDGVLKLADFGLAININDERPVTRAGTLAYMAPEVLVCPEKSLPQENKDKKELAYTAQVDIWAAGILAYELLIGHTPFGKDTRLLTPVYVMNVIDKEPEFPFWMSKDAKSFIKTALCKDADSRPTAHKLLKHPWVRMHSSRPRPDSLTGARSDDGSAGGAAGPSAEGAAAGASTSHLDSPEHPAAAASGHVHFSSPAGAGGAGAAGGGGAGTSYSPGGGGGGHDHHAGGVAQPATGVLSDDSSLLSHVGRVLSFGNFAAQHGSAPGANVGRNDSLMVASEHSFTRGEPATPPGTTVASPSSSASTPHSHHSMRAGGGVPSGRAKLASLINKAVRSSPTSSYTGAAGPGPGGASAASAHQQPASPGGAGSHRGGGEAGEPSQLSSGGSARGGGAAHGASPAASARSKASLPSSRSIDRLSAPRGALSAPRNASGPMVHGSGGGGSHGGREASTSASAASSFASPGSLRYRTPKSSGAAGGGSSGGGGGSGAEAGSSILASHSASSPAPSSKQAHALLYSAGGGSGSAARGHLHGGGGSGATPAMLAGGGGGGGGSLVGSPGSPGSSYALRSLSSRKGRSANSSR